LPQFLRRPASVQVITLKAQAGRAILEITTYRTERRRWVGYAYSSDPYCARKRDPLPQPVPSHDTTTISPKITLRDTTVVLTKLADDVETWMSHGVQPPLPQALVMAVERIGTAMRACRPTTPTKQTSHVDLVTSVTVPGEDVTAKDLWTRLAGYGWATTNQAISLALHRAAERGVFERRRRGVYRLTQVEPNTPTLPTDDPLVPPELQTGDPGHATQAKAGQEAPM
jgi:hypothetical protein